MERYLRKLSVKILISFVLLLIIYSPVVSFSGNSPGEERILGQTWVQIPVLPSDSAALAKLFTYPPLSLHLWLWASWQNVSCSFLNLPFLEQGFGNKSSVLEGRKNGRVDGRIDGKITGWKGWMDGRKKGGWKKILYLGCLLCLDNGSDDCKACDTIMLHPQVLLFFLFKFKRLPF